LEWTPVLRKINKGHDQDFSNFYSLGTQKKTNCQKRTFVVVAASVTSGSSVAFAAQKTSDRFEKQRRSLRGARTGKMRD
jgi:hypothetical protein